MSATGRRIDSGHSNGRATILPPSIAALQAIEVFTADTFGVSRGHPRANEGSHRITTDALLGTFDGVNAIPQNHGCGCDY
jgi:hypothetical protein